MAIFLYRKIRDSRRQRSAAEPWTEDGQPSPTPLVDPEERKAQRIRRLRLLSGLFLPATMQGLNLTMIAGALAYIASDFHQFSQLNWIISAATLTCAAFIPFWGQLADIFGRYAPMQASLLILLVGSALCAGSPTTAFPMLLVGRALAGVGLAGALILMRIILADGVSLRENAVNNSIFTLISGISYGIGPTVGGYLTDVSWRWVFIINAPLGVIGMVVFHFTTRKVLLKPQESRLNIGSSGHSASTLVPDHNARAKLASIDVGGQFLFLSGMVLFILALTWAGAYYPWSDAKVVAPLVVGVILLIAFIFWETLLLPGGSLALRFPQQRAMIPLNLVFTRNAGALIYINFVTGMAMYAVFYFTDLYFTIVQNFPAGKAGTALTYYLPGLGVGAYMAIFSCNVYPRKTWYPLAFGTVVEALGITLLAMAIMRGHLPTIYGMLAFTGVGTGIRLMPGSLHGVGYHRDSIAAIITIVQFAISFGQTLASTIMLNIFNNVLTSAGISLKLLDGGNGASTSSLAQVTALLAVEQDFIREHAKTAIAVAFYGISAFMWLGVIVAAFMGNVDLKKDGEGDDAHLTKGPYLVSLFRSKRYRTATVEKQGEEMELRSTRSIVGPEVASLTSHLDHGLLFHRNDCNVVEDSTKV